MFSLWFFIFFNFSHLRMNKSPMERILNLTEWPCPVQSLPLQTECPYSPGWTGIEENGQIMNESVTEIYHKEQQLFQLTMSWTRMKKTIKIWRSNMASIFCKGLSWCLESNLVFHIHGKDIGDNDIGKGLIRSSRIDKTI